KTRRSRMQLELSQEELLLRDTVDRFLAANAASADPAGQSFWTELAALGILDVRAQGGSLLDAVIVAELLGRHRVLAPVIEAIVVRSALAAVGREGSDLPAQSSFVPRRIDGENILVPWGGSVGTALIFDGRELLLWQHGPAAPLPSLA